MDSATSSDAEASRANPAWRSLRWKIAALVATAACAVALAVGLLVHRSTYERLLGEGGDRAVTALLPAVHTYRQTGRTPSFAQEPPPPAVRARLARTDGFVTWYDDRRPDIPWMWAAQAVGGRILAVKVDMGSDLRGLEALDRHMAIASLTVLAVVVPLSALAAELPNRRLRRVAATARRIAAGDLDARTTPECGGRDEISEIAGTVDAMADSLRDRLLNEQRFTADVAHELRTPLMGLVAAVTLLPPGEATDLVTNRVQALRTLAEDLLEISRLDAGIEQADLRPVPVAELVRAALARSGLDGRVTVAGRPTAETDPRRLDRILANLLANAARHGAPPVEISVSAATIVVRDHGPGYPAAVLADGPRRFRTGTPERGRDHGIGLTIALGQARVIGAALTFANAADGGAVATLRLPPPRDAYEPYMS
ncbi:sensor histidine kinase [Nonomuraea jiangxiensis]|uniref:histidine kinase n=1 Tax=Nonomuraea jiangxiensis TaxID=633440 RepID=A0A1G9AWC6_9ACTN|nr:HAMP domain-containing sensor histidine kinase [Nonomuraea jiangxiensis]SDK31611.1 Signal transduction histidine kinase [Nonomuraea jiangxiensis]